MTVTLTVSVTDSSGNETVTTHDFETAGTVPLSGDVSGTFGDCFVQGDLNLTGDLFIEGLMTGIDTFRVQGNGFSVFFQNGGRADLHGKFKARWGPWGTDSTGWSVGDRIAVAPTAAGAYTPSELLWVGGWASMPRPSTSPDVTLVTGALAKPEVANLSQSIVFENLARGFHIHDSGGVMSLSDIKFLNCGTSGVLGNYPIHFHLLANNSRGSLLERVVVENGKNHAFVTHGSHGITLTGCVAYRTTNDAYWWDIIPNPINDSNDIDWSDCLALQVFPVSGMLRTTGFVIGAGVGDKCNRSVAVATPGTLNFNGSRSGFLWPEEASRQPWEFKDCVAHNNKENGSFAWQNNTNHHLIENFTTYHNGRSGINHGAYVNDYAYLGGSMTGDAFLLHALSRENVVLRVEDFKTNGPLKVLSHNFGFFGPTVIRNIDKFSQVMYAERGASESGRPSWIQFFDCGLHPVDFKLSGNPPPDLSEIHPDSIIEIFEAGVRIHRWAAGVWS